MLTNLRQRFWGKWFVTLPKNDPSIASRCQNYLNVLNGDNDWNQDTNGEVRVLQQLAPLCQTIFDVGANVGQWTQHVLTIQPDAQVHCFEPSLATFEALRQKTFGANVTLNNVGLSSAPATRPFYKFAEQSGMNSLYMRNGLEEVWGIKPQALIETVQLTTLDAYCLEHAIDRVDFLKIDVEGHELDVLKGATTLLNSRRIRYIQFEYGGTFIDSNILLKHLFELLLPLGYHFYKIMPATLRPVAQYDRRLENFQYQNWIASVETGL